MIGAGISGLAAAIRLAAAGQEVHVFESNAYPGGKIHQIQLGPYRFDGGPSLLTQPHYIRELFDLAGKDMHNYIDFFPLEETCRYFWEDGTSLISHSDPLRFDKHAQEVLNSPAGEIVKYLEKSKLKYERVGHIFLERSLHKWKSWLRNDVFRALLPPNNYDLFSSLHQLNKRSFSHPKLVQLFDRFATYNGSDPFQTSGIMSIISHFELNKGAFLPAKGMYDIAQSLYQLGKSIGVQYHFNCPVTSVLFDKKTVEGIESKNKTYSSSNVVVATDIAHSYKSLLKGLPEPKSIKKHSPSSSAIVFYWGINKPFQKLSLHNIFFADNYKKEFKAIENGNISSDPTIYVNISSKHIKEDAPANGENWFVMINVPYDSGQDWKQLTSECRQNVIKKLNRMLGEDIERHIEVEDQWTPSGIAQQTASYKGAIYGTSSNSMMSAFNRHPNFHPDIRGLYFCGGSVHPGGGIPLCLLSAKIMTSELLKR